MGIQIGDSASDFHLPGVDGKKWSLQSFNGRTALAVVFSCNHCPYVQAYETRMVAIRKEFGPRGFEMAAINSNDDKNYPDDSFDNMVLRAKEQGYNFSYLRDASQQVAQAYGATRTPHVFLFDKDKRLRYMGAIDDNWEHPDKVKKRYLASAVEALLAGQAPPQAETFPVGCTIKWAK